MSPAAWQAIGPSLIPKGQTYGSNVVDVIGRVSSIAVDPNDPKHLLLGAAGGGIWESQNTGAAWAARTDQMPSLAIGAIAFDPTNPKKVYAGSGEGNFYANLGAGVYKSLNGGATWTVAASAPFVGVGFYDLVVDPQTPAVLYAATTNGFYKSTNSGAAWSLKRAGKCWDISVHPTGGTVEILAAFADGLFVSINAGNSFTAVALPSWPAGNLARLAVDHVRSAPAVAYAFAAKGSGAHLWRRVGTAWTKIASADGSEYQSGLVRLVRGRGTQQSKPSLHRRHRCVSGNGQRLHGKLDQHYDARRQQHPSGPTLSGLRAK